jgi:hypothetical protein
MTQFVKVGRIVKDRRALRIEIDGREACGEQVIGSSAVSELLTGRRVDISFVQTPSPDRVFIGFSGEAWVSRSGKAITLRIGGVLYTAPLVQVRQVLAGTPGRRRSSPGRSRRGSSMRTDARPGR